MGNKISQIEKCTLWKADRSPSCRAVMMAIDKLDLDLTEVEVDFDKGGHKTKEIVAMNPRHTLPILKDKGLLLCDSHAIIAYLVSTFCRDEKLLPVNPAGRALVDQAFHYHSGVLHPRYEDAVSPILYRSVKGIYPPSLYAIYSSYADLECMLSKHSYIAGCFPTVADMSTAATVSSLTILVPIDPEVYPNLSTWLYRMADESYYQTGNKKGLTELRVRLEHGPDRVSTEVKCTKTSIRRRQTSCITAN